MLRDPTTCSKWNQAVCSQLNHLLFLFSWLTLAARMLRLYVSTDHPSDELRMLVEFVVGHYFPVWCASKKNGTRTKGAQNLFRAVELLRVQPEVVQRVVRSVIQRNAYWAQPEQLLLAMVADEQQSVREEAVRMITAARQCEAGDEVRPFTIPALRFGAERYNDLIRLGE